MIEFPVVKVLMYGCTLIGVGGIAYTLHRNKKDLDKKIMHDILEEQQNKATNQDINVPYKTIDTYLKK